MSKWLINFSRDLNPKLRIFAFPYAGGTGHFVRGWQQSLPQGAGLYGIQAPGREDRAEEPAIDRIEEKVEQLYPVLAPYLDKPFILMGHSNGALTAFELARRLQKNQKNQQSQEIHNLKHFIISAKRAPHLKLNRPKLNGLTDREVLQELAKHSFQDPQIILDWDIMKNFIPMIRADYGLADHYQHRDSAPLNIPATLMAGVNDVDSPTDDVWAWARYFTSEPEKISFQADHAFVKTHANQYQQHLNHIVQTELQKLVPTSLE
jgi:surfactin synthase thioesterase subunit